MERPSSTVRRRAWINSSRQRPTLEEQDPEGSLCNLPSASIADDDVFSDGCFTGKIENWLLGCGPEACSEKTGQQSFESVLKASYVDDELSLGADASLLNDGEISDGVAGHPSVKQRLTSTPRQQLHLPSLRLGQSMASSFLSSSTCTTKSSISDVLRMCSEDAEETLYELGFGCDEPQVTCRIPPRFFTFPSLSQGINFRLFLDAQLRRIREEDPSLSLASRFRQVQVLTAMANAFYSLYSHVSRTPLQKLAAPEFTFSSSPVERIERFRSSVRSEPRSPVERLKDTVSKMCLYTGSPRGSDSTSPQPSPRKRSSLPGGVDIVLEKVQTGANKKLDLGECDGSNPAADVRLVTDCDGKEEQTQQAAAEDTGILGIRNKVAYKETQGCRQTGSADETSIKPADLHSWTHSVGTSLTSSSGETVVETDHPVDSTQSDTRTADLKSVAKVTYDLICPQITESVHQAPFCAQHVDISKPTTTPTISSETGSTRASCPGSQTAISEPHATALGASRSPPLPAPDGSYTQCCIAVTVLEGDNVSPRSPDTPDSSHTCAVSPVQACEESFKEGKMHYLNPQSNRSLGHNSDNLQQVNSFELEEVHSAGEEDFGQSDTTRTAASSLSKNHQCKGEVVRGDSMQSDSSGYADEEVSLSSNTKQMSGNRPR